MVRKSVLFGLLGMLGLLGFYFLILTLVSGWGFALIQFSTFWYFIIALGMGFGVQVGLYSYLRQMVHHQSSGRVVAVSGTASTLAMISCCSHYLVNILPIIAVSGVVTFVAQYQVQFFWVGLLANLLGIVYMLRRIIAIRNKQ